MEQFVAAGAQVTALDNFSAGRVENLDSVKSSIRVVTMDIRDESLEQVVSAHDVVIHMAANADVPRSVEDPCYDFENNVMGSYNVLRACMRGGVSKVVFASSAAVYGEPEYSPMDELHPTNPASPYGAAKLAIEKLGFAYHRSFGLPFTAVRIFNTYGVRQPRYVMYDLLKKLYRDPTKLIVLGTGEQVRDYSYVTDTARCFLLAAADDASSGEVYNVAGAYPITIRDLADKLIAIRGAGDVSVSFTGSSWPGDIAILAADITKAEKLLGFAPTVELHDGLARLDSWLSKLPLN